MLVNRYENKHLITVHLRSLFDLPSLIIDTANDLRTIRDQVNSATQAFRNLALSNTVLVFLITEKLDPETRRAWELKLGNTKEYSRYSELDQFLESHLSSPYAMISALSKEKSKTTSKSSCFTYCVNHLLIYPLWKTNHLLYQCSAFLGQASSQRFDFIKRQKRCLNCFSTKHSVKDCTSIRVCRRVVDVTTL